VPAADQAVSDREASGLFRGLEDLPGLLLAISGGPDSTALLVLAARWAKQLKRAPKLIAVTVDHGLRPEAAREAAAVRKLSGRLGVPHRTLRWRGKKPRSGLQEAARNARYQLLAQAARREGIAHIATAHTLDDQAEMNANLRNFALWVIIVLLLLALFTLFQNPGQRASSQDISFSQLLTEVDAGQGARRRDPGTGDPRHLYNGSSFQTYAPNDPTLVQRLYNGKGVSITAKPPATTCRGSCRCWSPGCRSSR
jgi:tRNA(Ile)-lysidine synthase